MTFQTQIPNHAGLRARLGLRLYGGEVREIFYKNLINIKAAIEGDPRPHPWQ